jgi:hypothetical protein
MTHAHRHHWGKWQRRDALLRALSAEHDVLGPVRRPPVPTGVYARADWRSFDLTEPDAIAELGQMFEGADVVVTSHGDSSPPAMCVTYTNWESAGRPQYCNLLTPAASAGWYTCLRAAPTPPGDMASASMNHRQQQGFILAVQRLEGRTCEAGPCG